jgi:hypothetical protein
VKENSVTLLTERYCEEATVFVSVVAVLGNPIITVRIVPRGDVGATSISFGSAVTVQGAAMAGLLDTLSKHPWKVTT